MDEMTLTLNSPITEEQLDAITDVDFDCTDRVWFHTKHGKDVEFVKPRKGKWIPTHESTLLSHPDSITYVCSECGYKIYTVYGFPSKTNYCPNCGADMRGEQNE